jgi:hypothetical protein
MSARREAYSSTVVAPLLVASGLGLAVLVAIQLHRLDVPLPVLVLFVAVVTGGCAFAGTVRLAVGGGRVILGHGPFRWPARVIAMDEVVALDHDTLDAAQAFGVGVGPVWFVTRMTPRAGPALQLTLRSGERVRITTPRPDDAARVVQLTTGALPRVAPAASVASPVARARGSRPWFGPKRVGVGFRPQTWQGWAVTAAVVVAVLVLARLR